VMTFDDYDDFESDLWRNFTISGLFSGEANFATSRLNKGRATVKVYG
jgi:hypothetical protein